MRKEFKRDLIRLSLDWSSLVKLIQNGVKQLREDGYEPKDFDHYVFETAMEILYGKDIWKWWNKIVG